MEFIEAEDTVVTFGEYKGATIGDIADYDITYLDELLKENKEMDQTVTKALEVYLSDPAVNAELKSVYKRLK